MTSEPRRLHRAGILIGASAELRGALIPFLVVALVTGGLDSAAEAAARLIGFGLLGVAVSAIVGYIRWERTTYSVADGAVRLRTGVFEEREKSIPLERLQSIDAQQGPLQRLFGVQGLRLQSAGSGGAGEIALNALSDEQVAELRAALSGAGVEAQPSIAADAPCRRLGMGSLITAGLTSAQFGFLVPVAAAAAQTVDDLADPLLGQITGSGSTPSTAAFVLALGAVLALAWIVAFAATIVAFSGFTITRVGNRLLVKRGLLVRRDASVPVARVQAVRVVDGLLRQPFGLTQLRVETSGYADERADAQTLFPLLPRSEVGGFLAELLPELDAPVEGLARPPARAARRYVLPPVVLTTAPALAGALVLGIAGWWWLPAGAAVVAATWGTLRYRAAGWSIGDTLLVVRERRLARSTVIARRRSVDIRSTTQTAFQRRARLATLHFAIASKHRFGVRHLDAPAAAGALRSLAPR